MLTLRDPTGYSSHSGRIGAYSGATVDEDGSELPSGLPIVAAPSSDKTASAAKQLGWASDSTPNKHYKRKTVTESRATG